MEYHTSLLTAVDSRGHVHLVVGANTLAASRCAQSLAVGARPVLIAAEPLSVNSPALPAALQAHVDTGAVAWVRETFDARRHLSTLGRSDVDGFADAVFVTESDPALCESVAIACRRQRVPVNVVDRPDLCSFSLLSSHVEGPLQIGITTNGSGCKLAARIRREVAAALPPGLGEACVRLGALRRRIQAGDRATPSVSIVSIVSEDDSYDQTASFNQLVTEAPTDDAEAIKTRRMRWLAQMCEYWPLKRLAGVTDADVEALLEAYTNSDVVVADECTTTTGRIILAGAGPGHPDLLTRAAHQAILSADVILADKLVPQGVLDLIPRRAEVAIARKFPGNAEAAQDELIAQATAAARAGKTVLRLKQGDPFVYGRGGEEVLRLREAGFRDGVSLFVLPGVTSALSAPLFAGIPSTHRDAADQVLICTGTGKKGKPPAPPGYRASRTAVFLMALHRIAGLVSELTAYTADETDNQCQTRILWPASTPCAVIERASCPDQKVIRTTLASVAAAIEQEGSRPPGLLVVGRACDVLYAASTRTADADRPWSVEDGFAGLGMDLASVGLA